MKPKLLTFLTLTLALLLLLVSCNTPTPPTESTPESTGAVDPVESTTSEPTSSSEPSVVTTEAPTAETDPPVTDPPVTEAVTNAWKHPIINPEIWETERPAPSDEPVKISPPEKVWHFTMWKPYGNAEIAPLEVPEEKQDLALKFPLTYECERKGLAIKVEFFKEYYLLSEHIPVRVTIENQTDHVMCFATMSNFRDMSIYDSEYYVADYWGSGSKAWRREHVIAEVNPSYFPRTVFLIHGRASNTAELWENDQSLELFPKGTDPESIPGSRVGQSPDAAYFDYAAGTYSFEYLLAPKGELIESGEEYIFVFSLRHFGVVEIPVEVAKVEVVEN